MRQVRLRYGVRWHHVGILLVSRSIVNLARKNCACIVSTILLGFDEHPPFCPTSLCPIAYYPVPIPVRTLSVPNLRSVLVTRLGFCSGNQKNDQYSQKQLLP